MLAFLIRRSFIALITIWAISIVSFTIIQLPPGDYLTSYIAQLRSQGELVREEEIQALRQQYGLGRPFHEQYARWTWNMLRGDFGMSMEWNRPVRDLVAERLPLTVGLTATAMLFTWVVALAIGIYSAVRQYSIGDYAFTFLGFLGLAVPDFLLALVLMFLAYRYLGTSIGGLFSPEFVGAPWSLARVWDMLGHLWIPTLLLATAGTARLIRIMRANLLDELRKPYVVTARAKGLSEFRVVMKYPVRVALNPFVSTLGLLVPLVVSGSIVISVVLSLPTVGPLLLRALLAQDMFLAGAIVLLLGVMTVVGVLLSDILLVWFDPRIRLEKL